MMDDQRTVTERGVLLAVHVDERDLADWAAAELRRLGAERYGIWVLVFSILDYFWFFDLGLNTAVTNFCARFLATREPEKINEVINTALFYFLLLLHHRVS